jgi:hypothetical protein
MKRTLGDKITLPINADEKERGENANGLQKMIMSV